MFPFRRCRERLIWTPSLTRGRISRSRANRLHKARRLHKVSRLRKVRLRQRQVSLALLVALVGLAGPLIFFLYTLLHGPLVLLYVALQYAVFGFILWQFTRPAPLEEEAPQHGVRTLRKRKHWKRSSSAGCQA